MPGDRRIGSASGAGAPPASSGRFARTLPVLVACGVLAGVPVVAAAQAASRDTLVALARDMMERIRYCAVITRDASGRLHARTVDAFAPDERMVVWFATNPKSRKVEHLRRDPRVTLHYYDATAPRGGYVTLFGRARLVDDPDEKRKRWKPGWEAFWTDRDAGFLLVEVVPERLEISNEQHGITSDPDTWAPPGVDFDQAPGARR